MPPVRSNEDPGRRSSGRFPGAGSLLLFMLAAALPAPAATTESPILLLVPSGARLAEIEAVRAGVPPSRRSLLVAAGRKVRLEGGLTLFADASFADAPESELIVALPGEEEPGVEAFLRSRRASTRAILFLGESPLALRLTAEPSPGALLLTGGPESLRALASAPGEATAAPPPGRATNPSASPAVTPALSPTTAPSKRRVFDRYFSGTRPATPTRTPLPGAD